MLIFSEKSAAESNTETSLDRIKDDDDDDLETDTEETNGKCTFLFARIEKAINRQK
jgi:hypothetical protein